MALYLGGRLIAGAVATSLNPCGNKTTPIYIDQDFNAHECDVPLYPTAKNIRIAGTNASGGIVERAGGNSTVLYVNSSGNLVNYSLPASMFLATDANKNLTARSLPPANAKVLGTNSAGNFQATALPNNATAEPSNCYALGWNTHAWQHRQFLYGSATGTPGCYRDTTQAEVNSGNAQFLGMSGWNFVGRNIPKGKKLIGTDSSGNFVDASDAVSPYDMDAASGLDPTGVVDYFPHRITDDLKWKNNWDKSPSAGEYAVYIKDTPRRFRAYRLTKAEKIALDTDLDYLFTYFLPAGWWVKDGGLKRTRMLLVDLCHTATKQFLNMNVHLGLASETGINIAVDTTSAPKALVSTRVNIAHVHPAVFPGDFDIGGSRNTYHSIFPIKSDTSLVLQWRADGPPHHMHLALFN